MPAAERHDRASSAMISIAPRKTSARLGVDMRHRRAVPAGRAVFVADGAGEHPGADARISRYCRNRLMDELAQSEDRAWSVLQPDAADKYPSELSGGMIKRAALGPRLGARSGDWCSSTSRPRASIRSAPRNSTNSSPGLARYHGADGLHGDPRPRQPVRRLRPNRGAWVRSEVLVEGTIEDMLAL